MTREKYIETMRAIMKDEAERVASARTEQEKINAVLAAEYSMRAVLAAYEG